MATIKTELLEEGVRPAHTAARKAIFEYIRGYYNTPAAPDGESDDGPAYQGAMDGLSLGTQNVIME